MSEKRTWCHNVPVIDSIYCLIKLFSLLGSLTIIIILTGSFFLLDWSRSLLRLERGVGLILASLSSRRFCHHGSQIAEEVWIENGVFWRKILLLSKTRSATQTGIFCLYFLTGILERWSFLLSMPRLKDVRNSLLIAHNNSLMSDEEFLLLLLDENSSENPQFNYEKYERFDIDDIYHWHWTYNIEHYTCIYIFQYKNKS